MKKIIFILLLLPVLIFGQVNGKFISNRPSGGSLDSVQFVTLFNLHQTTLAQTITLPNLSPSTSGKIIYINDVGSVSLTLNPGGLIVPGTGIIARWDGFKWNINGNGNIINYILPIATNSFLGGVKIGSTIKIDTGIINVDTTKISTINYVNNQKNTNFYWNPLPNNPLRKNNRIIKIRDVSNINLYDLLLSRTTIIKWVHSGNIREAMIISATYASDSVTITTIGDTIAVGSTMSSVMYSIVKCKPIVLAVAGTIAVGTDLSGHYYSPCSLKIFGADVYHGTAGTSNSTTYDIKINGTSIFTTKLSITSGSTSGLGFSSNNLTTTSLSDYFSIDCINVSITQPVDAYVYIYVSPLKDIYLK